MNLKRCLLGEREFAVPYDGCNILYVNYTNFRTSLPDKTTIPHILQVMSLLSYAFIIMCGCTLSQFGVEDADEVDKEEIGTE